jgi:hypothetical protein
MGSNRFFALVLALAGLYVLLFHIVFSSSPCVGPSLCLPPRPVTPPSPIVVAWADLVVGVVCLLLGGLGLFARSRTQAG